MVVDLTGQRFGRLVVNSRAPSSSTGIARWLCWCSCGAEKVIQGNHLRTGAIQSCGCMQQEATAAINRSHGLSRTPTYVAWCSMVQRCTDQTTQSLKNYGARGITICERWLTFENFLADMGLRPPGMTIERTNNDGNYEPGNCRWATRQEQNNNTRRNRFLTAFGRTQTAAQWGREVGKAGNRILRRIDRGYWSVERALGTP